MGGAVSAGQNNAELVDNLCMENYISTPEVEKVFRQVDRADFMLFPDDQDALEAYEDHAWRRGKLHLSAPCIYTRAVEALHFKRGVSFLNVGSGTGYLSTMAGLLIGPYGINHGIEIYPENIDFAYQKQEEFLERFAWYDPLEFCEPLFVIGNGLLLSPGNLLYDRIYCGAACPPEHVQLMKNMLAVGGILVMPNDNQLESVHRISQAEWKTEVVLPSVSFAPLILPSQESVKDLEALEISVQPLSLKQCCRLRVLEHLGRDRYCRISDLPLPHHLKEYVRYYREWGPSTPPVKLLCPIDHSSRKNDDSSSEDSHSRGAEGGASRPQNRGGARGRGDAGGGRQNLPHAQSMRINGRRMLVCNINGLFFQIPIESDDNASGSEEAEEAVKEEGTAEKEVEEEEEMAQEDEDGSSTDHSDFNWSANSGEMLSLQDSVGAISEGDPGMDASLEIGENSMEDGLSQEGASLAEGVSAEVLEEGKGQSNKESTTSEQ